MWFGEIENINSFFFLSKPFTYNSAVPDCFESLWSISSHLAPVPSQAGQAFPRLG